jgi:hypothetical protein
MVVYGIPHQLGVVLQLHFVKDASAVVLMVLMLKDSSIAISLTTRANRGN